VINVVDLTEVSPSQTERAELLEKVERAAQEWRGTFDAVEMPIVIVGRDLAVARMNRAARMLAGKTYEEVVGVSLRQLPPAEPWLSMADLAATSQQSRGPGARQVRDSSGRTLDLLAMLFNAAEPADDRVIVIVWDVSALVDLQSRLEQQRQMATMGALVAGVAHEVRNPLFAISATVDALEQIAGADLGEYFEVLREEIDRMTRLMQELLAYGRPTTPVFSDLAVQEIVEAAARACSAAAGRQHVDIAVHSLDGLMISADRDRMIRAVENLIMNAIQHSPQGGSVTVEASRRREARSEAVTIAVRDQGRGIAEGDLPRIFDPFFSRRKGGTGLGLALVQQIVTEHGGEVRAANVQGGGAEVVVTIPAKRSHAT
jgi:signal transduction histidine kinase